MPAHPVARFAWISLVALAAWSGGVPSAAAQPLKSAGDERVVGRNRTGEECRLRLMESRTEQGFFERYALFCEGWTQPSGEVRRFGLPRDATPEKVLT